MLDVLIKTDDIIDLIDQSDIIKSLKKLKKEIDKNDEVQMLISNFNKHKKKYENDLIITKQLSLAKEELYNHPLIYEYRKLFNELNLSILLFNTKILKLLNNKSNVCNNGV